jgi:hypothetical protein
MGVKDWDVGGELIAQMSAVAGERDDSLNSMVATVKGIAPRDTLQATLASQMASVHVLTHEARQSARQREDPQGARARRAALNKLARTFLSQVETLKRYRTGGEQRLTVQHVSVNDNAQRL